MTLGANLGDHLMMAASDVFYIAIDYKNKSYVKVAASNINIKINQLFSKQRIFGARVTIAQRKISRNFTGTYF